MFQEFPYTNFHQLNLDWIVKIAKDFLDQYTHIQEVIQTGLDDLAASRETGLAELDQKRLDSLAELNQKTLDGLADLQEKYDTLNGLLQSWYDTHSADIAGQLADAIADFNLAAETKSQALLDSWPADYSELVTEYNNLKCAVNGNYIPLSYYNSNGFQTNGITFTINDDMSISASGTATANAYFYIVNNAQNKKLQPGNYVFSGMKPADSSDAGFYIVVGSTTYNLSNNGTVRFTVSEESVYSIGFFIKNEKTVSGLTVYPILYYYDTAKMGYHPSYERPDEIINAMNKDWYKNLKILPDGSDLDDYKMNGILQVRSTVEHSPAHNPFGTDACVVIVNNYSGTNYYNQIAIRWADGKIAYRNYTNGTWSDWGNIYVESSVLANYYKNYGTLADGSDLDDLTSNGIYQALSGSHSPDNNPFGTNSCTIIVNSYYSTTYANQIAVEWDAGRIAYRRMSNNVWGDWAYNVPARNNTGKYYAFGDSTTYGYSSDHNHAQSPWNYPAIVGKLTSVEVHNVADPGQGLLKDWSVGTTGNYAIIPTIEQMILDGDFSDTVLITVGWAYNDADYYGTVNFGNPTDPIPENTTGITTWIGYYAKILDILQKAAPTAAVILVTGYGYTTDTEGHKTDQQFTKTRTFADGSKTIKQMYDALEEMANYYGFSCINQAKGSVINRSNGSTIIGDGIHPTYDNYRLYGNFIASKITSLFQNI